MNKNLIEYLRVNSSGGERNGAGFYIFGAGVRCPILGGMKMEMKMKMKFSNIE